MNGPGRIFWPKINEIPRKTMLTEKRSNTLNALSLVQNGHQRTKIENRERVLPNNHVNFFSYLSINWMTRLMWKACRQGLVKEDIDKIDVPDAVAPNHKRFLHIWEDALRKDSEKVSFLRVIWRFNRSRFFVSGLLVVIYYTAMFSQASWIIKCILDFLGNPMSNRWQGATLIVAMSVALMLKNVAFNLFWIVGNIAGLRTQGALQLLIYEKIMRLKSGGENQSAELLNYYAGDIERIVQTIVFAGYVFGIPIVTLLNTVYGYWLIGPWSLLGNSVIYFYYPLLVLVIHKVIKLRVQSAGFRDQRIGILNQVLSNIKSIKMYSWEEAFHETIKGFRKKESWSLFRATFLENSCYISTLCFPCIAPTASIIGYALMGGQLSTSLVFTYMSMSGSYMAALHSSLHAMKATSDGLVSCRRIQSMLLASEMEPPTSEVQSQNTDNAITITNAIMTWSDVHEGIHRKRKREKNAKKPSRAAAVEDSWMTSVKNDYNANVKITLNNIQLTVQKGQLIGICGSVGSGKSTLFSTLTRWGTLLNGSVSTNGSIAIVTQKAWIFGGTIRENITFGLPYEEASYQQVIWASCLEKDFALMANGDLTEIGERGANLSGGQKQRISLARALYSNRDIYLLDDIFSAVDVNVCKSMFTRCVKGLLSDKTVMLATHAADLLENCDYIIVMRDGVVVQCGKYCQLKTLENDMYVQAILGKDIQKENKHKIVKKSSTYNNNEDETADFIQGDKMVKDEVDANASLTWRTWLYFCRQCGGYTICLFNFFTTVVFNLAILFHGYWVKIWINEDVEIATALYAKKFNITELNTHDDQMKFNMLIWMVPPVLIMLTGLLRSFLTPKIMIEGATRMHHTMFWKIMRCPMTFFITTPLGRIIHRFSKDMDELDIHIPFTGEYVMQNLLLVFMQIVVLAYVLGYYVLLFCTLLAAIVGMDMVFNGGVREFKRVANLFHPNILIHVSNTIQGLPIIRCYDKENMFIETFKQIIDANQAATLLFQLSSKWLAFRLELITWVAVTAMTAGIVYSKGTLAPSAAGLAMLQITWIALTLAVTMRWKADLTARTISIERIAEYCLKLPHELPAINKDNRPPPGWPNQGAVDINNVFLRYQPEMPYALQGITAHIKAKEKVGIIGRTGAGKSSTIEALLRLTEICDGSIVIDGTDISKIGLRDLRSSIAIVPQDPVLFSGTIRWNLDPFNKCSDEEIWNGLAKVHLKSKIYDEPTKLDTYLNVKNDMFSLGEKQLFCLARALLKKSKILILDEAMASVDSETDIIIQRLLQESFSDCTLITVAHRLNTIADYDKIMTMDQGKIIEFDAPQNLLANNNSMFRAMMMKSLSQTGEIAQ